jgi:formylmethanofuran dehydrogenase subunit C
MMVVWGSIARALGAHVMSLQQARLRVVLRCRPVRGPRRGMVLVTAVLALAALLGMAALTIDIGRVAVATQSVQAIADAAALAAAHELPDHGTAALRLTNIVEANNAITQWPQVMVALDSDVTWYEAGDEVPGYGLLTSDEAAVRVVARANEQYLFARVAGLDEMNIQRSAIAKASIGSSAHPALFAGETAHWLNALVINGSHAHIEGDTHANSGVVINGAHHHFFGPLTYRNNISINGAQNQFDGGYREGEVMAYPIDYTWEQFTPWTTEINRLVINGANQSMDIGHLYVNGNVTINGSNFHARNGILMVEGNVVFNGAGHLLDNVTIIAKGSITFNGACQTVTPYVEDLALMSLQDTAGAAITFNGANQHSYGTLFAPNGGITYNGANQQHQYGSIIGKRITANGAGFTMYGTPTSGGSKQIRLIQ